MRYIKKLFEYLDTIDNNTANYLKNYLTIDIVDFINMIATKLGYKTNNLLKGGGMGIAYTVNDPTKILKITWDEFEARNAYMLKKINTYRIINYYDVRKINTKYIKINTSYLVRDLYVLISDKIQTIEKDSDDYNILMKIINLAKQKLYTKEKVLQTITDLDEKTLFLIDEYFKIIEECEKYNVGWYDAHVENIGYGYEGQLVFFDVGNDTNFYHITSDDIPVLEI